MKKTLKTLCTALTLSFTLGIVAMASPDSAMVPSSELEKIELMNSHVITPEAEKKANAAEAASLLKSIPVKINTVGTYTQNNGYYCGPASAQNTIYGHTSVPSQSTLASDLGTNSAGTRFEDFRWEPTMDKYIPANNYTLSWTTGTSDLRNKVKYTINKSYDVILNVNHGPTSTPIHPQYSNGIKHYVTIYRYNDYTDSAYISDSNGPYKAYTTKFSNAGNTA